MTSIDRAGGPTKSLPAGRYGISGLLRSEWTKLRTVRSTMWTLGVTVVLGIGVSVLATAETGRTGSQPARHIGFDPISTSLIGVFIGQFAIGVLGVLVMSAEYGTGTIRATLSAAPRRPLVLVAKVIVFGAVALVVAEVVSFLAFFVGQALLTAPAPHATLSSPGAWRAVVGSGLYVAVLGLFSLGLATIIRHTAGAISAFVGILLVLPLIVQALPTSLEPRRAAFPSGPHRRPDDQRTHERLPRRLLAVGRIAHPRWLCGRATRHRWRASRSTRRMIRWLENSPQPSATTIRPARLVPTRGDQGGREERCQATG